MVVARVDLLNLQQALAVPVRERSEWLQSHAQMASWVEPQRWPEVQAIASALARATGRAVNERLDCYERDAGVRAVVALYAAGCTQGELTGVVTQLVDTDWWRKPGASRGLSTFTLEVVRRVLTDDPLAGELDPRVREILADREKRKAQPQTGAA